MQVDSALTYVDIYKPRATVTRCVYEILLVLTGTVLLAVSAKVQIPMWPVPITAQTFAVLLIAALFGSKRGVVTMLAYLGEGALGLPVFAGPVAGLGYFAGPTVGFLIGFVIAAMIVGRLAERGWDRKFKSTVAAMTVGTVAIFACGLVWLLFYPHDENLLVAELYLLVPGAIIKIVLAAALLPSGWKVLAKLQAADR